MQNLKEEVIKFAQKLNTSNLSPLRSGNVSVRTTINNIEGFLNLVQCMIINIISILYFFYITLMKFS